MVSLRKRRLRNPSPPAATSNGTDARIREPTEVRNTHELSFNVRSDLSLEMSFHDHESEETNAHGSEDPVTPGCPVPETARRTPLDQTEARVMSMSPILGAEPHLNQEPNNVSMESRPSTEFLELGHAIAALPTSKMLRAGVEISHEDEDTADDSMFPEGEEQDAPEIMSSGPESSDRSLETQYLDSWCESPSVSSRRRARRAAFKRWNSNASPECLSMHRESNAASRTRMKSYTRNSSRATARQTERR